MWQFWLVLSGICFVIEMMTVGFFIFWFGIGALIAMITSFLVEDIFIQSIIFIISSTLLLFLTRKFVKRFEKKDNVSTNAFSIIGKRGIVTKEINQALEKGQVKIGTEIWSAKTKDESIIPMGTEIEVTSIEGVKAVVTPVHTISTIQIN